MFPSAFEEVWDLASGESRATRKLATIEISYSEVPRIGLPYCPFSDSGQAPDEQADVET